MPNVRASIACWVLWRSQPVCTTATRAGQQWQQDEFWISFWVGPQVPLVELESRIAEVAEANFTGFLGFNGTRAQGAYEPSFPQRVAKEIALCDKYGLKCVPSLCGVPAVELPIDNSNESCLQLGRDSPNFWGFQLYDEPSPRILPALGKWSAAIARARPDALRFFNLLPAAEIDAFPNETSYEAYVNNFVEIVKPQVLSMDFYTTFGSGSGAGRASPWPGFAPSPPGVPCPRSGTRGGANGDW